MVKIMENNAYERIADDLIALIESSGKLPFEYGWFKQNGDSSMPSNYKTGKAYNGTNLFVLAFVQMIRGYATNYWIGYQQAKDLNAFVKKGEKGTAILQPVFTSSINNDEYEESQGKIQKIRYFKVSYVWNVAQTTIEIPKEIPVNAKPFNSIASAEAIIEGYANKPQINFGGNGAFYNPILDYVQVPVKEAFKSEPHFYSAMFHELSHSTGHAKRLDRKGVASATAFFGSEDYSFEELVAEFSACFLCSQCGILNEKVKSNGAAYLQHWVSALKNNKQWLIQATQLADKAAKYIIKH